MSLEALPSRSRQHSRTSPRPSALTEFTNKVSAKALQMAVALEGKAPWGEVGRDWQDGKQHSYCAVE